MTGEPPARGPESRRSAAALGRGQALLVTPLGGNAIKRTITFTLEDP
jgi:hypothetical protein